MIYDYFLQEIKRFKLKRFNYDYLKSVNVCVNNKYGY